MAFTGAPVVQKISDRKFRVTGVSLAADASGTIGFTDKTLPLAEASLDAPEWHPYGIPGNDVSLIEAIECRANPVSDVSAAVPISIVKTGTTHLNFVITLHNDNAGGGQASADLEIWVEYH